MMLVQWVDHAPLKLVWFWVKHAKDFATGTCCNPAWCSASINGWMLGLHVQCCLATSVAITTKVCVHPLMRSKLRWANCLWHVKGITKWMQYCKTTFLYQTKPFNHKILIAVPCMKMHIWFCFSDVFFDILFFRSIHAGNHKFVFFIKMPLILVAVFSTPECVSQVQYSHGSKSKFLYWFYITFSIVREKLLCIYAAWLYFPSPSTKNQTLIFSNWPKPCASYDNHRSVLVMTKTFWQSIVGFF